MPEACVGMWIRCEGGVLKFGKDIRKNSLDVAIVENSLRRGNHPPRLLRQPSPVSLCAIGHGPQGAARALRLVSWREESR